MANVSDKSIQQLATAVDSLVTLMKQRNGYGSTRQSDATRLGRGGNSNAKSTRRAGDNIDVLVDNLRGLHVSMKTAGQTISNTLNTLNPLKKAFNDLETTVEKLAETQSRAIASAAKSMKDFIKAQNGNLQNIQEINNAYTDYVELVNQLVAVQKNKNRDEEAIRKALEKEVVLREKLNNSGVFDTDVASEVMKKYFEGLTKNNKLKLGVKSIDQLGEEMKELNGKYKAVNEVTSTFIKSLTNSFKKNQADLDSAIKGFVGSLKTGLLAEAARAPNFVQSRLQTGFTENHFMDAFSMGMSAPELNEFRAATRESINALTKFGEVAEKDATESLKDWSNNAKQVGLIGKEAAQFTSDWMKMAYRTGQTYTDELNAELTTHAMVAQQVFDGTIQDSAKMIQDYSTQTYNIAKFNKEQSAEGQKVLQKELAMRIMHTKYMGYDVEYLKQQDQMRHNAQFSDIVSRFRGAIMGEISANTLADKLGWTEEERKLWSKSGRPGVKLSNPEQETLYKLNSDVAEYKLSYEQQASNAGGLGDFFGALAPHILEERALQERGGESHQSIVDNYINALPVRKQTTDNGNRTFEEYVAFAEKGALSQAESVDFFAKSVMEFSEAVKGFGGLPGAILATAIGAGLKDIVVGMVKRRIGGRVFDTITSAGKRLPGFGAGAETAAGTAAGGVGATGATAAGKATLGSRLLKGAKGGIGGLVGGLALDYAADAAGRDTKTGAGLDVASSTLGLASTGALIGSVILPGPGTAIGGAIGGILGAGKGLYENRDTLFDTSNINTDITDPKTIAAMLMGGPIGAIAIGKHILENRGQAPNDPTRTNTGVGTAYDAANGIQRDANGNPISDPNNPINELVEINRQQLEVAKGTKKDASEREERDKVVNEQLNKTQRHNEFLAGQYRGMF